MQLFFGGFDQVVVRDTELLFLIDGPDGVMRYRRTGLRHYRRPSSSTRRSYHRDCFHGRRGHRPDRENSRG